MPRLDAAARKQAILDAALPLFASRGFHAVSTRDLAREAGISEALLYRHFPSKDAIYEEMRTRCAGLGRAIPRLADAPASTATLALGLYFLARSVVFGIGVPPAQHRLVTRLVAVSLLEDGAFARVFLATHIAPYLAKYRACWDAAAAAGDLVPGATPPPLAIWLAHHAAFVVALANGPAPVVDYGPGDLAYELTTFALRGLGLTPSALELHAHPERLATAFAALITT